MPFRFMPDSDAGIVGRRRTMLRLPGQCNLQLSHLLPVGHGNEEPLPVLSAPLPARRSLLVQQTTDRQQRRSDRTPRTRR